ncbi:hypothetical protein MMC17_007523 [Xylographa soralifera]|nr:hypothetical protein [Xylographa soralifera]
MAGVPGYPNLQFDLFDALGLPPLIGIVSREDIIRAWRRVKRHLHPRATVNNNGVVPTFPTYRQARDAYHYLTAQNAENVGREATRRIYRYLRTGRAAFRSTWNPTADAGTPEVLLPIPGAVTVQTAGPPPPLATGDVGPGNPPPRPNRPIGARQGQAGAGARGGNGTNGPRRMANDPPAAVRPPPPSPPPPQSPSPPPFTPPSPPRVRITPSPITINPGSITIVPVPITPTPMTPVVSTQTGDDTDVPRRRRTVPPIFRPPPPDPFAPVSRRQTGPDLHPSGNTGTDPLAPSTATSLQAPRTATTVKAPRTTTIVQAPRTTVTLQAPRTTTTLQVPRTTTTVQAPRTTTTLQVPRTTTTVQAPRTTTTLQVPRTTTTVRASRTATAPRAPRTTTRTRHAGGEAQPTLTFDNLRAVSRQDRIVVGDTVVGSRHFAIEGHIARNGALNLHRVNHDVTGRPFRHAPGHSAVLFENVRLVGRFRECRNDRDRLKRWVTRERKP